MKSFNIFLTFVLLYFLSLLIFFAINLLNVSFDRFNFYWRPFGLYCKYMMTLYDFEHLSCYTDEHVFTVRWPPSPSLIYQFDKRKLVSFVKPLHWWMKMKIHSLTMNHETNWAISKFPHDQRQILKLIHPNSFKFPIHLTAQFNGKVLKKISPTLCKVFYMGKSHNKCMNIFFWWREKMQKGGDEKFSMGFLRFN